MKDELITGGTFADNICETSIPSGLCERNDAIDVQEGDFILFNRQ
ncbi:hypothetical protein [Chengkuizengella axinellae]|uniref:Uncharacterized protein n=1 Tax=Chengkuizengella axinellae TaxID=3064388 RepID=A0ABT9IXK9_9BACL|nr:hypothetical protein [Chengkuizengella sp. 2205SS18-9]MDP5274081.1 hypothetical protein [Chengkuizengella sp. 2205SS18-9]